MKKIWTALVLYTLISTLTSSTIAEETTKPDNCKSIEIIFADDVTKAWYKPISTTCGETKWLKSTLFVYSPPNLVIEMSAIVCSPSKGYFYFNKRTSIAESLRYRVDNSWKAKNQKWNC